MNRSYREWQDAALNRRPNRTAKCGAGWTSHEISGQLTLESLIQGTTAWGF